ncbi:MAG: T9SS type A sorting domain-containing protein [bacterium]|nr:T9SS type A sorting domain-containing protein [bacterium]
MRFLLILLFFPTLLQAQQFQFHQELDSIPVWDGDYQMPTPWLGGESRCNVDFCDIDGDSDFDLFLGSQTGDVFLWKNIGSSYSCEWNLESTSFQSIACAGFARPEFWDMDSDGDQDLFLANWLHPLIAVYKNIGDVSSPLFEFVEDTLKDISNDRIYCQRAALADLDQDGDQDLLCGEYGGFLYYYENLGDSAQFLYSHIGGNFLDIDVGESASPTFCDIDSDGDYDLFIGNKYGKIYFYRNDGTAQQYDFTLVSNNWFSIDVGDYASPEFCDIDGDGDYDLFIGKDNDLTYDIPGAMQYWENIGTPQVCNFILRNQNYLTFDAGNSCEPDLCDIDLDGDLDLFFLTNSQLGWMENIGTNQNPEFTIRTFDLLELPPGSCDLGDLNGDQYPDLVTVDGWGGAITLWVNRVTPQNPTFVQSSTIDTDGLLGEVSLGDLDADGDLDLIVGGWNSSGYHLLYYQNQGTSFNPNFIQVAQTLPGVNYNYLMPSSLVDLDMDGDLDLLLIENFQEIIYYYENIGSPQAMYFSLNTTNLLNQQTIDATFVNAADIDFDGDMDLFVGYYIGGIQFFRNVTGDSVGVKPSYKPPIPVKPTLSLFPNPSNAGTVVRFTLPGAGLVRVELFDVEGRNVGAHCVRPVGEAGGFQGARSAPLQETWFPAGTHDLRLDASDLPSGVYLIRLDAGQQRITQKMVVVK